MHVLPILVTLIKISLLKVQGVNILITPESLKSLMSGILIKTDIPNMKK